MVTQGFLDPTYFKTVILHSPELSASKSFQSNIFLILHYSAFPKAGPAWAGVAEVPHKCCFADES